MVKPMCSAYLRSAAGETERDALTTTRQHAVKQSQTSTDR